MTERTPDAPHGTQAVPAEPAGPAGSQVPPPAQPVQAFVPYHNEIYRFGMFGLGGVRGDVGPALRIGATFLFILLTMGAVCFACWFTVFGAKV